MKFYVLGALLVVVTVGATLVYLDDGTLADFIAMFAGDSNIQTPADPDGIPIFFTMLTIYSVPVLAVYCLFVVVLERFLRARSTQYQR